MTQAEKLEALIRKASWFKATDSWNVKVINDRLFVGTETEWHTDEDFGLAKHMYSWQEILFNKDFARALFGEERIWRTYEKSDDIGVSTVRYQLPSYDYHRQAAVISDDPIDYMYHAVFDQ